MQQKNMLVAVTGMTPQVVTETLYGLMVQKNIPVKELFVITTVEGKEALLGRSTRVPLPTLKEEIERLGAHYHLPAPSFDPAVHVLVAREESLELHDIRTDRENQLFPNLITEFIKAQTADPTTILHCSIAGGRKTMSVALASALSLFGRKDDKLYHVVVSKEFEDSKRFFPETPEQDAELVLSEVPYIRLRERLPLLHEYPHATFSELVGIAQGAIDEMVHLPPLILEKATRTVTIGNARIRLRPFDFAFYLFCAQQRKPVIGGKHFSDAHWKRLWKLYERVSPASGHRERVWKSMTGKYKEELLMKAASNIRLMLKRALGKELAKHYAVASLGESGQTRYTILLDRSKIIVRR
jgi:CRISPR-associated protein (TIGR02584 family)